MYIIVPLPNYKCTYDQIDLIEKQIKALYRKLVLFLRSKNSFRYIPGNESEQDILGWNTSMGPDEEKNQTQSRVRLSRVGKP